MQKWQRRLKDLSICLNNCFETYFDPELFRLNLNQFLQTQRTVTFLIQKEKANIPEFDAWYNNFTASWHSDEIMTWAKNSRNIVEKQGDLEIYSTITVSLIFSYFEKEDIDLVVEKPSLLAYNIKKLTRFALKKLPSHLLDSSAIRITRKWISSNLPKYELLQAMQYVYARLYECCKSLDLHLSISPTETKAPPLQDFQNESRFIEQIGYLKLRDLHFYRIRNKRIPLDPNFTPPTDFSAGLEPFKETLKDIKNIADLIAKYKPIIETMFNHSGFHMSVLKMFDENFQVIEMLGTDFQSQSDKYIFWRQIADNIRINKPHAMIWISDLWIKKIPSKYNPLPISKLEITGEMLSIWAITSDGIIKNCNWSILRKDELPPELSSASEENTCEVPAFLQPAFIALTQTN